MATISLLVMSAPGASQNVQSALRFAQTVAQSEHQLKGIFFYADGVLNANFLQVFPADEQAIYSAWTSLATQYQCPLLVCVTAASKRGVLSQTDASDNDLKQFSLQAPFEAVGLGELAELFHSSDKVIQF